MLQSATSTFTRTLTVAQGVFAPGHLGELTKYLPFELVDDVLAETGAVQRRLRVLQSRVGVYFLLALGLFPHLGYAKVWDKLVTGLAGLPVAVPSEKAFREHPDAEVMLSFPGLGAQLGARILAEIGDDRSRFDDARGLKAYAGAAPITRASGQAPLRRPQTDQEQPPARRGLSLGLLRLDRLRRRECPLPAPPGPR